LPAYFEFANRALGGVELRHDAGAKCIAQLSDAGAIAAVVVYTRFANGNCEMSVASDGSRRWLNRTFLYWSFAVPFLQYRCRRVMAVADVRDPAVVEFDRSIGFVEEGRLRRWFRQLDGSESDGVLFGMLREECRWLRFTPREFRHAA
jgi:hypothetical protein